MNSSEESEGRILSHMNECRSASPVTCHAHQSEGLQEDYRARRESLDKKMKEFLSFVSSLESRDVFKRLERETSSPWIVIVILCEIRRRFVGEDGKTWHLSHFGKRFMKSLIKLIKKESFIAYQDNFTSREIFGSMCELILSNLISAKGIKRKTMALECFSCLVIKFSMNNDIINYSSVAVEHTYLADFRNGSMFTENAANYLYYLLNLLCLLCKKSQVHLGFAEEVAKQSLRHFDGYVAGKAKELMQLICKGSMVAVTFKIFLNSLRKKHAK